MPLEPRPYIIRQTSTGSPQNRQKETGTIPATVRPPA
jgi:hypothetical protein